MIEVLYKLVFLVPSLFMSVVGCIANAMASVAHLVGEAVNEYFAFIYGVSEEEEEDE